jgi:hypothetical protein
MHKFNLIALSLLFMLSLTAAIPTKPEQALVKRFCIPLPGYPCNAVDQRVSVDFIYARRLEPTEPVALTSIIHINAN